MFRKALLTTAAAFAMLVLSSVARADTIVVVGNSTGSLATATVSCSRTGNTVQFTVQNTSPYDARITGIGFDLSTTDSNSFGKPNQSAGITGFTGTVTNPTGVNFTFTDNALGNVPQFNNAVLDFGLTTSDPTKKNNNGGGDFNGGFPNAGLAPQQTLTFTVTSTAFANMSEEDICQAIFLRFQRVGPNGNDSDVGHGGEPIPEPMTMILFGTGLAGIAARARRRKAKA